MKRFGTGQRCAGAPVHRFARCLFGATLRTMAAEPQTKKLIIAIDGPSGAGKGTIARALAARLHYRHVDTGAMYRAVAWKAREQSLDLQDEAAVAALGERASFDLEKGRVGIDGADVSQAIRTAEIDAAAAAVARHRA